MVADDPWGSAPAAFPRAPIWMAVCAEAAIGTRESHSRNRPDDPNPDTGGLEMARIVVLGAGLNGLAAAMLVARDGHAVTVLERDPAEPKGDAEELWQNWERPGVSHFRLGHIMLARWRSLMEQELPEVIDEVERLGGKRVSPIDVLPNAFTGGVRAEDTELRAMLARRPLIEGALAAVATRTQGVLVRRGTKAEALVAGSNVIRGVPHVSGVLTDGGEIVPADLVIDAMGRRTPIVRMLAAIGARSPDEQREDLGFVYYGRHFRNNAGRSIPVPNTVGNYDAMTLLCIPADADTFSWWFIVASNDRDMRELRDVAAWERSLAVLPHTATLRAASTPITGVEVMSGTEDQRLSLMVDGQPVVTGLVAVGDAAMRTNPSLGRGSSIGLMHVCTLRDVIRAVGPDRPDELVRRFSEASEVLVGQTYRTTLDYDRHRMAEIQANIAGTSYQPSDASWTLQRALSHLAEQDANAMRALLHVNYHLEAPDLVRVPPEVRAKVEALGTVAPGYPAGSPSRSQLLAAIRRT